MKKTSWILIGVIVIVLIGGIFLLTRKEKDNIESIEYKDIISTVSSSEYSLIYFGEENDKIINRLKDVRNTYKIRAYTSNITNEELNVITTSKGIGLQETPIYILFVDGDIVSSFDINISDSELSSQMNKYLYNIIPEEERYYKTIDSADAFIKKVNSNKYTIAVLGRESCTYCNLFLPVINNIAKDYDLDIYYFDSDNYDSTEYTKIIELDLTVPAKCTSTGEDRTLKQGFSKPLTIITKDGKLVDCIKGYVVEDEVLNVLKTNNVIKG